MAVQAGSLATTISPHVVGGAFVQQYYHILHETPDQAEEKGIGQPAHRGRQQAWRRRALRRPRRRGGDGHGGDRR